MRLLISLLLCCLCFKSLCQTSLAEQMERLSEVKPTGSLFVHFDKNVYSNNETAYFTGYLIKPAKANIDQHQMMAVVLIRNIDSAVVGQDKFLMEKGISFGSFTLPDSLQTGDYSFLVYTDRLLNGKPEVTYVQPITLKTNIEPQFKANMKLIENRTDRGGHHVLVSVTTNMDRFMPEPVTINYSYGNIKKTGKTDLSSQLKINLPYQAGIVDPNLYVKIKSKKDSSFISMAIPQPKNKAEVKFYPEGGNLAHGVYTTVAWEVKDQQRQPLNLQAFLYRNDVVIDTIETGSNGIGQFKVLADQNAKYTVKLIHSAIQDSLYVLPKALTKGVGIQIKEAVTIDSLKLILRSSQDQKLSMLIHNFRELYIQESFQLKNGYISIKANLKEIPKGLATVTIVNEGGMPLAERMFFAHYDLQDQVELQTDKAVYSTREKVTLKVQLTDTTNQAIVSLACVQNNRLEIKKTTDILNYTYLKNELQPFAVNADGSQLKNKINLEQILLVKGWRRYQWQDLISADQECRVNSDSLSMTGLLRWKKKPISEPATLLVFGGEKQQIMSINVGGHIDFKNPEFILPKSKKNFLIANQGNKVNYDIIIDDQFEKINRSMIKMISLDAPIVPSTLLNNAELVIKRNEKITTLKEVVITNKNDLSFNYRGANACGDYVCFYKILNCKNHINDFGNTQPIKGLQYRYEGGTIVYSGCSADSMNANFIKFDGFHIAKEFYVDDYKDSLEPAFFSTIYWNHGALLEKRQQEINFFTSDITGKFRIVVQGVSNKDLIYGEHFFEVKPKNN